MYYSFFKFVNIQTNLRKLNFISQDIYARKIQQNFRKLHKKHKISDKLNKITNSLHKYLIETIHSRFIFWMKHLHYAKLSKAVNLIIELMRYNSELKQNKSCKKKIVNYAIQNQNIQFICYLSIAQPIYQY